MSARLTLMQGPPGRYDDARRLMTELLSKAKQIPGLGRHQLGLDRSNGKAVTFTVYVTEESMKASVGVVRQIRECSAEMGAQVLSVDTSELVGD